MSMPKFDRRNEVVLVTSGTLKDVRGKILRQSPRTGQFTVELLEESGAHKVGQWVSVSPYECKALTETRT